MAPDAATLLRQHGIYVTAQRLAVLGVVGPAPHISADAVLQGVRATIGTISRQSVYDTLNTLTDLGVLRRIQPMGSPARYETRIGDNHHHVACRDCGRVDDVDCSVGRRPCLTASETHGFTIDEAEVVYWGRCPACQRANLAALASTPHRPSTSPTPHTPKGTR